MKEDHVEFIKILYLSAMARQISKSGGGALIKQQAENILKDCEQAAEVWQEALKAYWSK